MPDENPELSLQRVNETCLSKDLLHHLGDIGEKIARLEFVNMMNYKFSEKAHPLLQLNFPEELEQILTSNQFPYKQH